VRALSFVASPALCLIWSEKRGLGGYYSVAKKNTIRGIKRGGAGSGKVLAQGKRSSNEE